MSILIKGMEMPKSCSDCFINSCKGRAKNKRLMVQRGEDCPLIPVPPHGRLGDLEAAVEKLKKLREYHLDDSQSGVFIAAGISQCIEVLTGKDAPAVIPAEGEK